MQFESTSIATIMSVVLEAMQKSYNFDARPVLEKLGIDLSRLGVPGARFPDERIGRRRSTRSGSPGWPARRCWAPFDGSRATSGSSAPRTKSKS